MVFVDANEGDGLGVRKGGVAFVAKGEDDVHVCCAVAPVAADGGFCVDDQPGCWMLRDFYDEFRHVIFTPAKAVVQGAGVGHRLGFSLRDGEGECDRLASIDRD